MESKISNQSLIYGKTSRNLFQNVLLALALFLCLLIGKFQEWEMLLSVMLCVVIGLSFKYDEFYLYLAVFVFFLDQFNINLENPVYRIYSYLLVIKILWEIRKTRLNVYWFPALIVFTIFSVFAVGLKLSFRNGFNLIADLFVVYFVILKLYSNTKLLRKFFIVLVCTALCAGVYSILADNKIIDDIGRMNIRSEEIVRYCASYGDANYAGFFYNIAIFITLCLKDFNKILRVMVLLILHYFLLLTNSITAFTCYGICMVVYIVLRYHKKSIFALLIWSTLVIVLISAIINIPALNQIDVVENVIIRISEQVRYYESGRMDMFTSYRTLLWQYFYDYFKTQNILGKLFGGNVITSMFTEERFGADYQACHFTYLQGLLNFGIIGAFVVFLSFLIKTIQGFIFNLRGRYKTEDADLYRALTIISIIWIFFAFSIDYFLDWRFMLFYFI